MASALEILMGVTLASVGVLLAAMAGVVYLYAPRRAVNRAMAAFLAFSSVPNLLSFVWLGWGWLTVAREYGLMMTWTAATVFLPAAYLVMVGHAVPIGWTAWLRRTSAAFVLYGASVMLLVAMMVWHGQIFTKSYADEFWEPALIFYMVLAGTGLFGILAALANVRVHAAGSVARRRAWAYFAAFGLRDAAWIMYITWLAVARVGGQPDPPAVAGYLWHVLFVGYALFLTYGVLSSQILDIDMRLRFTIRQSTIAGAFVAVFLVVGTIAGEFLVDRLGYAVGGFAAALLVLAVRPLGRLGDRIASIAVPGASPLGSMPETQKRMVYQDQAQLAWADGVMSARERDILDDARLRLGLDANVAADIERAARAAIPSG